MRPENRKSLASLLVWAGCNVTRLQSQQIRSSSHQLISSEKIVTDVIETARCSDGALPKRVCVNDSELLPIKDYLVCILIPRDLFENAVLMPQLLELLVSLGTQMQWIASPEQLVSLSVIVQVWSGYETSSVLSCQQQHLTIPYPEEQSQTGPTVNSMSCTCAKLFSIHFFPAALTLWTQHGSTKHAEGKILGLIIRWSGATMLTTLVQKRTVVFWEIY